MVLCRNSFKMARSQDTNKTVLRMLHDELKADELTRLVDFK